MPWKTSEPEWIPEEYPKMLTKKDGGGNITPVLYPEGHEKQNLPVIFENADEEKAYGKKAKR